MVTYFPLVALLVAGGLGLAPLLVGKSRDFLSRYGWLIFFLAAALIFGVSAFLAFGQHQLWQSDPVARFLLPPHQDINYFVFYSFSRFFAPYLASLLVALALLASATLFNRRSGGVFFEKGEPYLAATSVFLVGHPGWLIYFVSILAVYLLLHLGGRFKGVKDERLPLYHLWAPVAFFVILLSEYWLAKTNWWTLLSF